MPNWSELIEKHGPIVWLSIRRLVSHEADAADCFQEVFVAALQMSRKHKVFSWTATLRHLATVKSMDCLRRRYRQINVHSSEVEMELVDRRAVHPWERAATSELADALRASLACIDPKQAEVFCLVCLDAMSYQDAATAIGIQPNHLGVLLNRARTALKEKMKSYAPTTRLSKTKGATSDATQL